MALFTEIDPTTFIQPAKSLPPTGRGAWNRRGIGDDYRYHLRDGVRVGDEAEKGLDYWSVSAGTYAIQARLNALGFLQDDFVKGQFGTWTETAVKAFQKANGLEQDGTVGKTDARALFTPIIDAAAVKYDIPNGYLRGEVNLESGYLDPGAVGSIIYYPDYRGVDRGLCMINSKSNPQISWEDAFKPWISVPWSGKRMRDAFDGFRADYPKRSILTLWQAAICNHNAPAWARAWARDGVAPNVSAAKYVDDVMAAVY